jgi:hypothetical protein
VASVSADLADQIALEEADALQEEEQVAEQVVGSDNEAVTDTYAASAPEPVHPLSAAEPTTMQASGTVQTALPDSGTMTDDHA